MPLNTRDVMLVIRAQDQATGVLSSVARAFGGIDAAAARTMAQGAALMGIGAGMVAVGAGIIQTYADMTQAAAEYNREAALTLTQVRDTSVSVKDIADIGRRVASIIPIPFEQVQSGLYDIFSSMDVTVGEAEDLLAAFSRAGVAGQTDLQAASRATIAILNGFQLPVSEVNRVLDVQFESVRTGSMTYEEFATAIGRAIPSAQRAGQSVETLGGMMAFLTRAGMTADQAATSTARSFDLLSNPKFAERMHDFGIEVFDAEGKFRPMLDVTRELRDRLQQMTPQERTEALAELTRGAGGVIQAMRFLNLGVGDVNDTFGEFTGRMYNSQGALNDAYDVMFNQPASQLQLLKNNWQVLRTEIGDIFLPIMSRLVGAGLSLINWFRDLSPEMQRNIAIFGAIAAVVLVVGGGITFLVGTFMFLSGAAALLGTSLGAIIGISVGIVAAIAAIIAIGYLVYRNWDTIKEAASDTWGAVKRWAGEAWHMMQDFWDWLSGYAVGLWHTMYDAAKSAWDGITSTVSSVVGAVVRFIQRLVDAGQRAWAWFDDNFGEGFARIFGAVGQAAREIFGEIIDTFRRLGDGFSRLWSGIIQPIISIWVQQMQFLAGIFTGVVWPMIKFALDQIVNIFQTAWGLASATISIAIDVIKGIITNFVGVAVATWRLFGDNVMTYVRIAWNYISTVISNVITIISNIIQGFMNVFQGDWSGLWNNVKNILNAAWNTMKAAVEAGIRLIMDIMRNLIPNIVGAIGAVGSALASKGIELMQGMLGGIIQRGAEVFGYFGRLGSALQGAIGNIGHILWNIGADIIQGLWEGMQATWRRVTGWLSGLGGAITNLKGPPEHDAVLLVENGKLIMQGLGKGLAIGWSKVENQLQGYTTDLSGNLGATIGLNGSFTSAATGAMLTAQASGGPRVVIENATFGSEKVVEDLDWFALTTLSGV